MAIDAETCGCSTYPISHAHLELDMSATSTCMNIDYTCSYSTSDCRYPTLVV